MSNLYLLSNNKETINNNKDGHNNNKDGHNVTLVKCFNIIGF